MKILVSSILCFISLNCFSQIKDCSECAERLLTPKDIEGKSLETLSLLRNEIFARKGYVFSHRIYETYFLAQSWYNSSNSNKIELSNIEQINITFLKEQENKIQQCRDIAILNLKELQKGIIDNNQDIIDKYLAKLSKDEPKYGIHFLAKLKKVMRKIDLDAINWNNGRGLYSVSIDNGYSISEYSIYFKGNNIRIENTEPMSHSRIFGDFDDGYSDYDSIEEHSSAIIFKMSEKGIEYQHIWAAG